MCVCVCVCLRARLAWECVCVCVWGGGLVGLRCGSLHIHRKIVQIYPAWFNLTCRNISPLRSCDESISSTGFMTPESEPVSRISMWDTGWSETLVSVGLLIWFSLLLILLAFVSAWPLNPTTKTWLHSQPSNEVTRDSQTCVCVCVCEDELWSGLTPDDAVDLLTGHALFFL